MCSWISKKKTKSFLIKHAKKIFASRSCLNSHKIVYDKSHHCEVCLKSFHCKSTLHRHLRIHTGEKPYVCSICGQSFVQNQSLQRHQATHSDERKFKCDICPDERCFKTKDQLSNHLVNHYEPKFTCSQCNKKFHTSSNLSLHLKFHFEPTYACGKCGKKFHTSSNLKRHIKRNIC